MFDELKEKASTLAKLGSFYNRTLNQDNRPTAHKLTHVVYQSSLLQDYNNISKDLTGQAYKNRRLKEFTYTDEDIEYCTFNTKLSNGNYASPNYIPNFSEVSILPEANQSNINNITLDRDYQFAFILNVPKDIYIRIIRLNDGSVLTEGLNFRSQFGKILLRDNPITLFNGMGFIALSYTQRDRNIMCYPLQLQDIYGDVSYVIDYYKNNQSLVSFKRALYQAIGLPVSDEDGYIVDKVKLVKGCSYISNSGKYYDAEFEHSELSIGSVIKKGKIITGEGIVKVYLPSDSIPADITHVALNSYSIAGDKEIYIENSSEILFDDQGKFIPKNFVTGPGRDFYADYVNYNTQEGAQPPVSTGSINRIEFLRNVVAANRCVIIQIDKQKIPYDMAMKLKSFVIDHAPIGVVIAEYDCALDIPTQIIESSTTIACFGNETKPEKDFITDSFYLQSVGDTTVTLNNGDTIFFDASVGNFYAGDRNGTVEKQWSNTKATQQINEALNLSNGFTNADFSELSVIYYTATGNGGSKSTITLDVSATAQVGDKIVLVVSCAAREQHTAGFSIEGITEDSIKLGYAGLGGDGFSYVQGASVTYSSDKAPNWSPNAESVQIFKVEGILQSTQLVIDQPGTWKNGWQFVGYRTIHEEK